MLYNAFTEEKDDYFATLGEIVDRAPETKEIIIIRDLNSRVGNRKNYVVGKFVGDVTNDNGRKHINFCREY